MRFVKSFRPSACHQALPWCKVRPMGFLKKLFLALALLTSAAAQPCPQTNTGGHTVASEARTLEGRLIFHDDIRKWFELKLDQQQCGETSIQLIRVEGNWKPVEILRGCRVRSTGTLDFSPTGYYSLNIYQSVDQIEPVGDCTRQSPFPDYSTATPDNSIRRYRVDMYLNYTPGDHPIVFHVTSAGRTLRPWQAYASYSLTGGFVLYGYCGKGFVVDKVFGDSSAKPGHFAGPRTQEDMAAFDPEAAAAAGRKDLRLGYTCVRR